MSLRELVDVDLLNATANTTVAVIAVLGAIFAYRQLKGAKDALKEARDVRTVTVYNEINTQYNSEIIKNSLKYLHNFEQDYKIAQTDKPIDHYVDEILQQKRERVDSAYTETLYFLTFLEYIGVIARKGLVDKIFIFDFMGGNILLAERCLKQHMKRLIEERQNETALYANTRWLMNMIKADIARDSEIFRYDITN